MSTTSGIDTFAAAAPDHPIPTSDRLDRKDGHSMVDTVGQNIDSGGTVRRARDRLITLDRHIPERLVSLRPTHPREPHRPRHLLMRERIIRHHPFRMRLRGPVHRRTLGHHPQPRRQPDLVEAVEGGQPIGVVADGSGHGQLRGDRGRRSRGGRRRGRWRWGRRGGRGAAAPPAPHALSAPASTTAVVAANSVPSTRSARRRTASRRSGPRSTNESMHAPSR